MNRQKTEAEQSAERISPRPRMDPEYAGVLGMAAAGTAISLFPLPDSFSIFVSIGLVVLSGAIPYILFARQRDRHFLTLAKLVRSEERSSNQGKAII